MTREEWDNISHEARNGVLTLKGLLFMARKRPLDEKELQMGLEALGNVDRAFKRCARELSPTSPFERN